MGEFGLKIRNIQAGSLKGYIDGTRNRYDYTDAMFSNSLFYYYIRKHGLQDYKDESTRDIVCIDFSYGTRSYEDEVKHLQKKIKEETDPDKKKKKEEVLENIKKNKFLYKQYSKDEIRRDFYINGVPIKYKRKDKNTGEIIEETIRYKMLYRNASKAKIGQSIFINEDLYDDANKWITMGLRDLLPKDKAKIVELSAYSPLVTSSIEDRFHLSLDEVLILDEEESSFHTVADVIKSADYNSFEKVIDEDATEKEKQKSLNNGKLDIYGNPIYKTIYKTVPAIKKRCVVSREETDVTNALWDGMALIESSFSPGVNNGMVLLRNHFFKACAFKANIQLFLKDYCKDHNINYDTYYLTDIFGRKLLAKNIKLITNKDACKWWKFIDVMGGTKEKAYEYWRKRVESDGSIWGVVKQDHVSKLGDNHEIQQLSYQAVNSLPCTKDDINKIAQTSVSYVELLKSDNNEFEKFLRKNATEVNHYEMLADLYRWNPEFINSKMWRVDKSSIINAYVNKLKKGKITVYGDNLTVCGNPYALLLYSVGEDWKQDPTLKPEVGVIQCYTPRFKDGEYLCGIRSPHNAPSNTGYFKNVRHPLMEKYMDFSQNIIAVNCIETDVQSRLNGMDFDADSMLVTNQPEMVEAARISYRDFPTALNAIGQSNKTYKNEMAEYARMDSAANRAQMGIGLSSNLAQMCLSYLWTKKAHNEIDDEYMELYHNCIILATLAQVLIDGIKRTFEVDAMSEIERIQNTPCMNRIKPKVDENGKVVLDKNNKPIMERKDLPKFMKYVKEVPYTKNGKEIPYSEVKKNKGKIENRIDDELVCPMNWLVERLSAIQGNRSSGCVETKAFFIRLTGDANNKQISKIRKIIEEYDKWTKLHVKSKKYYFDEDDYMDEFKEKSQEVLNSISSCKISKITMNRLIASVLGIDMQIGDKKKYRDASKYTRKMLNAMYKYDKEKFLSNFIKC